MLKLVIKKLLRFLLRISLAGLIFVLAGLILLQTPLGKKWILRTALTQVNQNLQGEILAARLEGNFISRLKLCEILVRTETDTLLKLAALEITFNPITLFSGQLKIHQIRLDSPEIFLRRTPENWNFTRLIPMQPDSKPSPTDTSGGFDIGISRVAVRNGQIRLLDVQQIIPALHSRDLFLEAAARYSADSLTALVQNFTWKGQIADLDLQQFFFKGQLRGERLAIDSLTLASDSSRIGLKGQIDLAPNPEFNLKFWANITRPDLIRFIPELPAFPVSLLHGDLCGNLQQFSVATGLEFQQEQIEVDAQIRLTPPELFTATVTTRRLNLSSIQGLDLPPSDLSLKLQIAGENFDPDSLRADARLEVIAPGTFNRQPIRDLSGQVVFENQKLDARFSLALNSVSAKISGWLDLADSRPGYSAKIQLSGPIWYELADLGAADDQMELIAEVAGRGFTPEIMNTRAKIFARALRTQGVQVDSLRGRLHFADARLRLDSLHLAAPFGHFRLAGQADFRDSLVSADYQFTDLNLAALTADSVSGTGHLTGAVSGRLDSLVTTGWAEFSQIGYTTNQIAFSRLEYEVILADSLPRFTAEIAANEMALGTFQIDSLAGNARLLGSQIEADLRASADTLGNLRTQFSLELNDTLRFTFHRFDLRALGYHFTNLAKPFQVTLGEADMRIDSLELMDQNQKIWLNGWVAPEQAQDLQFRTENLDLQGLAQFTALPFSGRLNAAVQISGAFQQPQAELVAEIVNPVFGDFPFEMLKIDAALNQNHLVTRLTLDDPALGSIINFSAATDFSSDSTLSWPDRFTDFSELRLRFNGLQLAVLNDFLANEIQLTGQVQADFTLHNLLTDMTGQGSFSLNGAVRSPAFGIDYKSLLLDFQLDQKNLVLNNFSILTEKGWLQGQGKIGLSKMLDSQFALFFVAKNFEAVNSKQVQLQLDADFEIYGTLQQPNYRGKIELERGRIILPSFLKLTPAAPAVSDLPPEVLGTTPTTATATESALPGLLNNLRGTLSLVIPRNTWLRNEEINIELSGELELIKKSVDFSLFGPVHVVRGNVQFYGKKFIIEKGELVFRGLYPPDPEIYILATFRHPDVIIQLVIGGTANAPQLTLQSTPELEQRDLFSYLLFGKPFAFLSGEQKDNLSGEKTLLTNAMGIAVGMLAGEITRAVANKLQLDIIEFSQGTDWQSATLKVGKYVGKGMFVFYSRDLVGANESVSLEYQINPTWLLKADQTTSGTAGVDLWWQKEW